MGYILCERPGLKHERKRATRRWADHYKEEPLEWIRETRKIRARFKRQTAIATNLWSKAVVEIERKYCRISKTPTRLSSPVDS